MILKLINNILSVGKNAKKETLEKRATTPTKTVNKKTASAKVATPKTAVKSTKPAAAKGIFPAKKTVVKITTPKTIAKPATALPHFAAMRWRYEFCLRTDV